MKVEKPELTERNKDAFINCLLFTLEQITKREMEIAIKQQALDTFRAEDHPVFTYDEEKEQWSVKLPKPKKKKIITPDKRIIT